MEIEQLKSRCTGCGACADACLYIKMKRDERGFCYPEITDGCNACGRCEKICPVINSPEKNTGEDVFAAFTLDNGTRFSSTSGGIFTELAKAVITGGGAVAGCAYDENFLAKHILITEFPDIEKLRQSKYMQSNTADIFNSVKNAAQSQTVLFCGTPCQCAAMKNFCGSENIILADFICRGVNSPLVFKKYLSELEADFGAKAARVWFKNKDYGWNNFGTKIIFENGKEYFKSRDDDPFMYGYIKKDLNLYMRESCYSCEFKGTDRVSDITLGDFWGIKNIDDKNGVSAVIINTEKGAKLFEQIKPFIFCEERSVDDILPFNKCFTQSPLRSDKVERFWGKLASERFSDIVKNKKGCA
jgi:coenzyme F420-reducing hydrogenase beta subunit